MLPSMLTLMDRLSLLVSDAWLWSSDLARAHRQLHICPLSFPLLSITLQDKFYIHLVAPFDCQTLALACVRTTRALVWPQAAITGKLHHLSKCIKPAAHFTNRVLAVLRATSFCGQLRFDPALLDDFDWFLQFAHSFNSIVLLPSSHQRICLCAIPPWWQLVLSH